MGAKAPQQLAQLFFGETSKVFSSDELSTVSSALEQFRNAIGTIHTKQDSVLKAVKEVEVKPQRLNTKPVELFVERASKYMEEITAESRKAMEADAIRCLFPA